LVYYFMAIHESNCLNLGSRYEECDYSCIFISVVRKS